MSLAVRLRGFLRCYKSFQPHARFFGTFIPENSGNGLLDSRKWKTPFLFIGRSVSINIYETPNPNSVKFQMSQSILNNGTLPQNFSSEESSVACSLASLLHRLPGVKGVYIGDDFITISKLEGIDWQDLKSNVDAILKEYFSTNKFIEILPSKADKVNCERMVGSKDDDVVAMIKELIETKIRSNIQEDGGDIIFIGFENGVVKVKLQGSCSGCPSSEVTLKRGVQNMLKFYVPEVTEVVQVQDEKDVLSDKVFDKLNDSLKNNT